MATEKWLIDANKARSKAILLEGLDGNGIPYELMAVPVDTLDDTPTVEAVEVVHGRWIDKTEVIVKPPFPPLESARVDCSVCGTIFWHTSALTYNYCPNCGADMRDGDGNA